MTEKPTILLVEDDRPLAELINKTLQRKGYDTFLTNHPAEAISFVRSNRPLAALIDLYLPEKSGLELIVEMKINGLLEQTSVIAISSLGFWEIVQQAVKAGAREFIVKPFNIDLLMEKLESVIPQ